MFGPKGGLLKKPSDRDKGEDIDALYLAVHMTHTADSSMTAVPDV